MDFVWIYAEVFSAWWMGGQFYELDYSMRSVRKNYQGDVRCFVIGDKPHPELDCIHIPAPPLMKHDPNTEQPRHIDLNNKLNALLESEVNEGFVLMYDDIFILKPTSKKEIIQTYGMCEVEYPEAYIRTRAGGRPYKKLWLSTYDYIKTFRDIKGLKTYDWETHLPRFMEKTNLKWIIEKLNLANICRIHTSLYSAHFGGETILMPEGFQSDLYTHKPGMDFDKYFLARHMNIGDDVIVPEFIEKMKELFG